MKLRIKDNSFRFRITLQELEELQETGRIQRTGCFPSMEGETQEFSYSVRVDPSLQNSCLELLPFAISFLLTKADLEVLADPAEEGFYLRREWTDGVQNRSMAFIEKDRPGSSCSKPESWIYDERPGSR